MAQDYANNILAAIEVLTDKAIKNAGYDKTVKAIVTSADQADVGQYICKYEAVTFTAVGLKNEYQVDDIVMVNIPENNWDNVKTILNKVYTQSDERVSTDILKDFLRFDDDPSTFFSFAEEQKGLIANVHKPFSPSVGPRSDEIILLEETSLESYYLEPYSKLYITTEFNTSGLIQFKTNGGTFGVRVIFRDSSHNIISQYELNTMNMIGNLYNFPDWVEQRILVTLDPSRITAESTIEVIGFQSGDFTCYTDTNGTVPLLYPDDFTPTDNILFRNGKMQLGYSVSEFKEGDLTLLSASGKQYYKSWRDERNTKVFNWLYWYIENGKLKRTNKIDLSLLTILKKSGNGDYVPIYEEQPLLDYPKVDVTSEGFVDDLSDTESVYAEEIEYKVKIKHDDFDTESSVRYNYWESNELTFYRFNPGMGGREYDELNALSLKYEYEDLTEGEIYYNDFENQLLTQEESFKPHFIHAIFSPSSEELSEEHWLGGATLIWEVPGLIRTEPTQTVTPKDLDNVFNKEKLFFIQSPKEGREYNTSVTIIEQIQDKNGIPYIRYTMTLQEGEIYNNDLNKRKGDPDIIISNDVRALSLRFLPKYQFLPSMAKSLDVYCTIKKEDLTFETSLTLSVEVSSSTQTKAANNRFTIVTERIEYPYVKKGENNTFYFRSYNHSYDGVETVKEQENTTILRPVKTISVPASLKHDFYTTESDLFIRKSVSAAHHFSNDPQTDWQENYAQNIMHIENWTDCGDFYKAVLVFRVRDGYGHRNPIAVNRLFRWFKYIDFYFLPASEVLFDFNAFVTNNSKMGLENTFAVTIDDITYYVIIGMGEFYEHKGVWVPYAVPGQYGYETSQPEFDDGTEDSPFTYSGEYILTADTTIDPSKTYYIQINPYTYEAVANPDPSQLSGYYEFVIKDYEKSFIFNCFHREIPIDTPPFSDDDEGNIWDYKPTFEQIRDGIITIISENFQPYATIESPIITPIGSSSTPIDYDISYGNGISWNRIPASEGGYSNWYKLDVSDTASAGALAFLALHNKNRGICNILEIPTSLNNVLMRGNNKIYVGPAAANGSVGPSEINLRGYEISSITGFLKDYLPEVYSGQESGYYLTSHLSPYEFFTPKIVSYKTDKEGEASAIQQYDNYLIQQDPVGFSIDFKEQGMNKPSVTVGNFNMPGVYLPIVFQQVNRFTDEFLEWDGKSVKLGETGVYGPVIGGGSRNSSGQFTGCLMGKIQAADLDVSHHGLFGYKNDEQVFGLMDNGKMFIGKNGNGQILLDGNKATIQSSLYNSSNKAQGMLIDLDDGIINIINKKNDVNYFVKLDVSSSNLNLTNKPLKIGTGDDPNFSVNWKGEMKSTAGEIGGWTIGTDSLSGGSGSNSLTLSSNSSDYPLVIGSKFKVKWDGSIEATEIDLKNGTLTGNDSSVIKNVKVYNNAGKGLNFDGDGNLLLDAGIKMLSGGQITADDGLNSVIGLNNGFISLKNVYAVDSLTMIGQNGGTIYLNGGQGASGAGTLSAAGLSFSGSSGISLANGYIVIPDGHLTMGGNSGSWRSCYVQETINTRTVEVSLANGGTETIRVFSGAAPQRNTIYYIGHT